MLVSGVQQSDSVIHIYIFLKVIFKNIIYLFIWLRQVLVVAHGIFAVACGILFFLIFGCVGSLLLRVGFSLVVVSGGYSSVAVRGLLIRWLLLL